MCHNVLISFHPALSGAIPARWPETACLAGAAGYDAVDIDLRDIAEESCAAVREVLEETGVRAGPAPLPVEFRRDEETFVRDLVDLPLLARLAADVGVRTLYRSIPASSEHPRNELLVILQRRLSSCLPVLRDNGLTLAIEVLGPMHRRREGRHEFLWRLPEAGAFAYSLGPGVGVLADSWHWHHAGEATHDIVALGERILHVHVADAPDAPREAIRDEERLLPGAGVVDFEAFFGGLAAVGYSGLISPEIHGYRCALSSRAECARRALAAVSSILPELS